MERKLKLVKFVLRMGIILDGIIVVLYLLPNLMLGSLGLPAEMLNPVVTYLLFHAGIFMFAWTILLLWALQQPVNRRFILLLTILITVGMEASAIYLLTIESIARGRVIPLLVMPVLVGSLFAAAYFILCSIKNNEMS